MGQVSFMNTQQVMVGHDNLGLELFSEYSQTVEESFTWGMSQTLGLGVTAEVTSGISGLAEAKVEVSTSFEYGVEQEWGSTRSKSFSVKVAMSPDNPGVYEVGTIVYVSKDTQLPYMAEGTLKVKYYNGTYGGPEDIKSKFLGKGLDAKIVDETKNSVKVELTGNLKATFGVRVSSVVRKISDL